MRPADPMPRLLAIHAAIGALAGMGVTAAIIAFDIAGLSSLAPRADEGWLALVVLGVALTALFAALALGSGLFLMTGEAPRRAAQPGPPVRAAIARTRSRWKV